MKTIKTIGIHVSFSIVILLLLGVICVDSSGIPIGEMAAQWNWCAKMSLLFALCVVTALLIDYRDWNIGRSFYPIVIGCFIILGGVEAVWGLQQIYGLASSNHSLYAMTGSFFNPGPYSGYLAMVLPICLNEWLHLKEKKDRTWIEHTGYYISLGVLLLILCILPAGMSRSAWMAAIVSGVWVCAMYYSWGYRMKQTWKAHRKKMIFVGITGLIILLLAGIAIFQLKVNSANGRMFMWKINCLAITEKPLAGHGIGNFAQAYGEAQEAYFAGGDYSEQEELVAGSPEYAFNEYLQVAIECGIPTLASILLFIGFCLWRGIAEKRFSACGGIISLLMFSFSSYPMQFPGFVLALAFLLATCVLGRSRIMLTVFALIVGLYGVNCWKNNRYKECRQWTNCKMLYKIQAYEAAKEGYEKLYPALKERGAFLFEYGHCLHKLKEQDASIKILKEAATRSSDPMILNVIGKNYQEKENYQEAEKWLLRSTNRLPGRIYPYYLLVKLYAEPKFRQPEKLKKMVAIVRTKEPKVQSTAVKEMREEVRKIETVIFGTKNTKKY